MSSREPAVHDWPAYRKIPTATASIAFSRFASGKTMTGALPPASSETRLNVRAPSSISRRPASLLPVKLILSTRGSVASASPTTLARADDAVGHAMRQAHGSGRAARRSPSTTRARRWRA